jgi:Ribbon-helix-helix protein, copG family
MKTERMAFLCEQAMKKRLEKAAKQTGASVGEYIRAAIEAALNSDPAGKRDTPHKFALIVPGGFFGKGGSEPIRINLHAYKEETALQEEGGK